MKPQLSLRCRCGAVRGVAKELSPSTGNHIVCYCNDCQAFARFLACDGLMDGGGGSEIIQLTPSQLEITEGADRIACMRLSDKGLLRWYADCCKTPIANTMASPRLPFAGLLEPFVDPAADASAREAAVGPVIARIFTACATGPVPSEGKAYPKQPLALLPRMLGFVVRGLIGRKAQPSPFFARGDKEPRVVPRVLTAKERSAVTLNA